MDGAGLPGQAVTYYLDGPYLDLMETRAQKIARYRLLLVSSDLTVPKDHVRHADLLRRLAHELAKDRPDHPSHNEA
jgi:hypothetical protein